ncbi:MAG: glycosyltransferase [Lachnospiraceae bacterium]|jgi:glycosyltransferase involved in cell wall biosynthesis|nr:glycosyltransferase [Lachnospiraceae bacterium]
MKKILSICIPVYNGGQIACQYIEEILTYEKDDIEVVVSDNASTDNTLQLLRNIDDDRLKIIEQEENRGPFLNWYYVLMAGTAEYVMLHQDNDRIEVKNLPRYIKFLKSVQYDVMRNCPGLLKSKEITVEQVQYYNAIYGHAGYVVYRREALHAIKPLKCSFDWKYTSYPYVIWDTQILMKYPLGTKKAYLNGDIKIVYSPRSYRERPSRTKEFSANEPPPYSYENILGKFMQYIKILKHLYPEDREYCKLIWNAYRINLYWAVVHFYMVMKKTEAKWVKLRYGLDVLDGKKYNWQRLDDDFYKKTVRQLPICSMKYRVITKCMLKLITIYTKNLFWLVCEDEQDIVPKGLRGRLDKFLESCVEKVCA